MIERDYIINNFEYVLHNQLNKGEVGLSEDKMRSFYNLEVERRKVYQQIKNTENRISKLFLKIKLKQLERRVQEIEVQIAAITDPDVPFGKSSKDNVVVRDWGDQSKGDFEYKSHVDIGKKLKILDFDRADKVADHMNVYYLNNGAKLERALYNFMLDTHTYENAYQEMIPPYIVNSRAMFNSGLYPRFENEFFRTDIENFSLIPSSAIPIENFHSDELLHEKDLPIQYSALSPCFRVEHGDCVA